REEFVGGILRRRGGGKTRGAPPCGRDRAITASQRSGRREYRRKQRRRRSKAPAAPPASGNRKSTIPTAPRWRSRDTSRPWSGRWSWSRPDRWIPLESDI